MVSAISKILSGVSGGIAVAGGYSFHVAQTLNSKVPAFLYHAADILRSNNANFNYDRVVNGNLDYSTWYGMKKDALETALNDISHAEQIRQGLDVADAKEKLLSAITHYGDKIFQPFYDKVDESVSSVSSHLWSVAASVDPTSYVALGLLASITVLGTAIAAVASR